jgi:serine/threonine protein phosphatase PrpC
MSEIKFTMAARCEAAGRPYNEDNFQLTDNLTADHWGFMTDREMTLSDKGALMVVCDGMGGMNAGEIASDLAVRTIKERFASANLTAQVTASSATVMHCVEQAIIAADHAIKQSGKRYREYAGMGSTVVLAWIIHNNVYVGWCGDSRCYRFNPATGLEQLSRDHSYVQELVDSGKLSKELAFDHPDNNIITRSLGDVRQEAQPDVKCFPLNNGDIILLCSDGLSGVLRDSEIESILLNNSRTMENCRNALWNESEKNGWTDNVTIALCQILSGVETPAAAAADAAADPADPAAAAVVAEENTQEAVCSTKVNKRKPKALLIILILLFLSAAAFEAWRYYTTGAWWIPEFIQELGIRNYELGING